MKREEVWAIQEEVAMWSAAEGSEGADYLNALSEALGRAHYSQCPDVHQAIIYGLIQGEISEWKKDERVMESYKRITGDVPDE